MIVPVPLSVAPDPPSHESRCADSTMYSSGFSLPGIVAIVLNSGTSSSHLALASTSRMGFWPCLASRKTKP